MINTYISLGLLLVAAGIAALLFLRWRRREIVTDRQLSREILTLRRERDMAKNAAIEEDIRLFLSTLKLPALEEETRLREAARQLRTVLVERIMRAR